MSYGRDVSEERGRDVVRVANGNPVDGRAELGPFFSLVFFWR